MAHQKDVSIYVENAPTRPFKYDDLETWFTPGRVVYMEQLIDHGFTVERLFALPFHYVVMCIRDEKLNTFSCNMLSLFDDKFHSVDILFSPWLRELDPALCRLIGLTMDCLLRDGLSRKHVRRLYMRMSDWTLLFGMVSEDLGKLGITQYSEYFEDVAGDLGQGGAAAGVPSIEL